MDNLDKEKGTVNMEYEPKTSYNRRDPRQHRSSVPIAMDQAHHSSRTYLDVKFVHFTEEISNTIFAPSSVQQHKFDVSRREKC